MQPASQPKREVGLRRETGLLSLSVFLLVATGVGILSIGKVGLNLFYAGPAQIVLGSVGVMTILLLFVTGCARLGLGNASEPLGLPAGSVPALVAIVLIVVFVTMSLFMFGTFARDRGSISFGPIDQSRLQDLQKQHPQAVVLQVSEEDRYSGIIPLEFSDQADKIATQLLTALLTLVATISAFYFGSTNLRQAAQSAASSASGVPRLAVLKPPGAPILLEREAKGFPPVDIVLSKAAEVAAVEGDAPLSVVFRHTDNVFRYVPKDPQSEVIIRFLAQEDSAEKVAVRCVLGPPPAAGQPNDE